MTTKTELLRSAGLHKLPGTPTQWARSTPSGGYVTVLPMGSRTFGGGLFCFELWTGPLFLQTWAMWDGGFKARRRVDPGAVGLEERAPHFPPSRRRDPIMMSFWTPGEPAAPTVDVLRAAVASAISEESSAPYEAEPNVAVRADVEWIISRVGGEPITAKMSDSCSPRPGLASHARTPADRC